SMDAGSTVVVPTAAAPRPAMAAAPTTNKTTVPLSMPEPGVKRPFESVVPSSEIKTKSDEPSFMNQIIEGGKKAVNDVAKSFTQFIDDIKPAKIECLNKGYPKENGRECDCPKQWKGKRCEQRVCFHGGHPIQLADGTEVCRCMPEEFISGPNCDTVTCQNGGMALDGDVTGCECPTIYTGQFCESNIFVTNAHIGIPALVLLVFLCCCFLCRMDLCPRRPAPGSAPSGGRSAPHTRRGNSAGGRRQQGMRHEQPPLLQQQPMMPAAVAAAAASSSGGAYVIRLDTIPTFNPQMIGGVPIDEGKILEPPPPYDEALNARCTIEPPRYQELPPEGSQVRTVEETRERRATPR
ncbi:hypothetical protein PENTCL1PPCAC_23432, partial [Pristionchus entomophagus]